MEVWLIPYETINPWFCRTALHRNRELRFLGKCLWLACFKGKWVNGIINLTYHVMWQFFSIETTACTIISFPSEFLLHLIFLLI